MSDTMHKFISKFLASYEYSSPQDLFESMFPSWKYNLQFLSLSASTLSAFLSYWLGFGPALGLAMLVSIIVEIYTGIKASKIAGRKIESFRFSRCILKLALWAAIFFIIHQFENEYINKSHYFDLAAYLFFKIVFLGAMSMFLVEHITSILENKAIIDGKPKTYLIDFIQELWKSMLNLLKNNMK